MHGIFESDTIAAVSTASGEGGISIVRLSGQDSVSIADHIFNKKEKGEWESHRLYYGHIMDRGVAAGENAVIDEGLAVIMKAPRSYTREDVLEIHCHGGYFVTSRILDLVLREGARLAEPGEFTKRAFTNGRIDLTQAEAVIDLIRAKSSAGHEAASSQLTGRLFQELTVMKQRVSSILAGIEAYIDFPEEDIESYVIEGFMTSLHEVSAILDGTISSYEEGRVYRDGISTVIIGRPNVGKSSLLNLLLKEKRAIVTSIPGTTRDVIIDYINVRGIPVKIADTAGIRDADDVIEQEGVRRAQDALSASDLALFVIDGNAGIHEDDVKIASQLKNRKFILVINKSDLPSVLKQSDIEKLGNYAESVNISAYRSDGLAELYDAVFRAAVKERTESSGSVIITSARHRDALVKAQKAVAAAKEGLEHNISPEFIALDLRSALHAIADIVGETTPETILNKIFSEFCIGK